MGSRKSRHRHNNDAAQRAAAAAKEQARLAAELKAAQEEAEKKLQEAIKTAERIKQAELEELARIEAIELARIEAEKAKNEQALAIAASRRIQADIALKKTKEEINRVKLQNIAQLKEDVNKASILTLQQIDNMIDVRDYFIEIRMNKIAIAEMNSPIQRAHYTDKCERTEQALRTSRAITADMIRHLRHTMKLLIENPL
jgi:hypothetical protein